MSKEALLDVYTVLDGTDLSGITNDVSWTSEADELESTTFVNGAIGVHSITPGLVKVTAQIQGFWSAPEWELARAGLGTSPTLLLSRHRAAGSPAWMAAGLSSKFDTSAPVGQMVKATGNLSGATRHGVAAGKLLTAMSGNPAAPTAISATGSTVGQQLAGGIVTGKDVVACIQVLAVTGTPTLTAKLQSDSASNFPSPTDVVTFSAVTSTSDPSAQLLHAAGPITDSWFRLSYTVTGTGTVTLVAAVGRA